MKNTIPTLIAHNSLNRNTWYTPTIPNVGVIQSITFDSAYYTYGPGYFEQKDDVLALAFYGGTKGGYFIDLSLGAGSLTTMNHTYSGYPYALWGCDIASNNDALFSGVDSDNNPTLIRDFEYTGSPPAWTLKSDIWGTPSSFWATTLKHNRINDTGLICQNNNAIPYSYNGTTCTFGTPMSKSPYFSQLDINRNNGYQLWSDYTGGHLYIISTDGSTVTQLASGTTTTQSPYLNSAVLKDDYIVMLDRNSNQIHKYDIDGSSINFAYSTTWTGGTPNLPFQIFEVDTNLYIALSHCGSNRNGVANWIIDTGTSLEATYDSYISPLLDTYNTQRYFVTTSSGNEKILHAMDASYSLPTHKYFALTWS